MTDGFLVMDKPPGITSHDVVAVARAVTGLKKVGHTGTLDPFATGVLPLALGGATRLIQYLDESEKVYDAIINLGRATDTGDPTGEVITEMPVPTITRADVERVFAGFVGQRMQRPPKYSAVKVNGRPLYEYARKGQDVVVEPRPIRIDAMELQWIDLPRIRVIIRCSRGTYARVIAEEVAEALGTVGHLDELRRDRSGPFQIDQALPMARLSEIVAGSPAWHEVLRPGRQGERVPWRPRDEVFAGLTPYMVSPRDALRHLPSVTLSALEARRFQTSGQVPPPPTPDARAWLLLAGDELLGVASAGKATAEPIQWERHAARPFPARPSIDKPTAPR